MSQSAIEFRRVRKAYDAFQVLGETDLVVHPGEFLALLGPSGCGKSTILKMIAGIEDPTSGEIYVDGELVNYALPRDRNVAMVFQNYALYPHMSVAKNIAYPLTTAQGRKVGRVEIEQRMQRAADIVDITDQLDKLPAALSGGQRQRVALARALIRNPSVFLMDEPLSNLDALLRDDMRHQLIDLHRKIGKATVYVTHDQLEAMTMADRIVVLNDGAIQQIGTPREIFQHPINLFVAGFVGAPRMNLVSGLSCGDGLVRIGGVDLKTNVETGAAGSAVTVGLRPTDCEIIKSGSSVADNVVSGKIRSVEFTGADSLVTLDCGEELSLTIRHPGREPDQSGDTIAIRYEPPQVHVFSDAGKRM